MTDESGAVSVPVDGGTPVVKLPPVDAESVMRGPAGDGVGEEEGEGVVMVDQAVLSEGCDESVLLGLGDPLLLSDSLSESD